MSILEYLYCKYFAFQVRVGYRDIAPFSAMLIIVFSTNLYVLSLLIFLNLIFGIHIPSVSGTAYLSGFCLILVVFYFLLVHKGKYKEVLKRSEVTEKSSLVAVLFPLIAFILFNVGWILKMLQNQGKL